MTPSRPFDSGHGIQTRIIGDADLLLILRSASTPRPVLARKKPSMSSELKLLGCDANGTVHWNAGTGEEGGEEVALEQR